VTIERSHHHISTAQELVTISKNNNPLNMAGELVFITGATGFVGFAVLVQLVKAGYQVRISVRKEENISTIKQHPSLAAYVSQLSFVVVPDITVEGAFDSALKDVTYIQHIASPLPKPTDNPERDIILPAIHGTTSILTSALKTPSIRRIVITSSIVAVLPNSTLDNGDATTIYTPSSRVRPAPTAPWGTFGESYRAAKALALDATDRFIAENKPSFTVVNVMPGYVIGANEWATDAKSLAAGSNGLVLSVVTGVKSPAARPGNITDIRDVARVHVGSLDEEKVKGNQSFLLDVGQVRFDDALDVASREFADAVKEGVLPLGGTIPAVTNNVDASATVEVFGKLRGYEDAVKSLLEQFVALKRRETAS